MSTNNNNISQTASSFLLAMKTELSELSFPEQNFVLLELFKDVRKKRASEIQAQERVLKEMTEGYHELDSIMESEIKD